MNASTAWHTLLQFMCQGQIILCDGKNNSPRTIGMPRLDYLSNLDPTVIISRGPKTPFMTASLAAMYAHGFLESFIFYTAPCSLFHRLADFTPPLAAILVGSARKLLGNDFPIL